MSLVLGWVSEYVNANRKQLDVHYNTIQVVQKDSNKGKERRMSSCVPDHSLYVEREEDRNNNV